MSKSKKRGTPRRQKRAPKKPKKMAALVVRRPALAELVAEAGARAAMPMTLTSDPMMVATFVGTLTLSDTQIAALRRKVEDDEVEWRSAERDGPLIVPYLSHNGYRDRLDAAFGLGGWGMVPVGQPKLELDTVFVPYAMVIGGLPRIYTWGEQAKHKMTYGDALEGAKSNAITRCGKELGIARDLWSKSYVEALKKRRGSVPADGSTRASSPPRSYHAKENEPITDGQRRRFWTIAKHTGRSQAEIAVWLAAAYNLKDTHQILRKDYDAICSAIERPGALPLPEGGAYGSA